MVNCPKCDYPQYCGCPACLPRLPEGYKPEIRNPVLRELRVYSDLRWVADDRRGTTEKTGQSLVEE